MQLNPISNSGSAQGPGIWVDIDPSLVEDGRREPPALPLDAMPSAWRTWIADTAASAGAPADYVALSVLAAVAGLGGCGIVVRVLPAWREDLVLRLAVVGRPSSGKSAAIEPVRRMLRRLEAELQRGIAEREPWIM